MLRALARSLGSPWAGLALLAVIFLYLAAASLLPGLLGGPQEVFDRLYRAWPLKLCLWALVLNVACVSLFRIPFRLMRLGAHLAHLGVLVLAGGATWYAAFAVSGYAVAHREVASGLFAPVDRFYLSQGISIYVSSDLPGSAGPAQTPLPAPLAEGPAHAVSLPVQTPLEGVCVTVTGYMPSAEVQWQWRDDGPVEAPGVELLVRDGPHTFRRVLCPAYAFAKQSDARQYSVRFAADPDDTAFAALARETRTDLVAVHVAAGEVALVVLRPDGSRESHTAKTGQAVSLKLGDRQVSLELVRLLSRAWRAGSARPLQARQGGPAARVEIAAGEWRGTQWVGYWDSLRPPSLADPRQQHLLLPGGRAVLFELAPRSRPLPTAFTIAQLEYRTYPNSGIPLDYVASLALLDDQGQPTTMLDCRLNRPADLGPLRLYQDRWRPSAEEPTEVIFLVRARPGIWAIWVGCGLICAGLPYGFYVKPLLRQRRLRRARR